MCAGKRKKTALLIAGFIAVSLSVWGGLRLFRPAWIQGRVEHAIRTRNVAALKRLLTADTLRTWPQGSSRRGPLHMAAATGDVEVTAVIMGMGADVNQVDGYGSLPLCVAASLGHSEVVRQLLAAGALPDKQDPSGQLALILAAGRGSTRSVEALIAAGANVNARGSLGGTALHDATFGGHIRVVETLLDNGADINSQTEDGCTAAHSAIWTRNVPILALLIKRGADLSRQNKHGRSVYDYAEDYRLTEFNELLAKASQPAGKPER